MDFLGWIKSKRKEFGYNQTFVAQKLGITQPQYSLIENGRSQLTSEIKTKLLELFSKDKENLDIEQKENLEEVKDVIVESKLEECLEDENVNDNKFIITLDDDVKVTADKYQYILHCGQRRTYHTTINSLIKTMIENKVKESGITSFIELNKKLEELNSKIDSLVSKIVSATISK